MALAITNLYSVGDPNLTALMDTTDKTRSGYHAVSLTHWSDTTVPAIAAGSKVEVNGALFEATVDEAIGGSPSDGTVYIKTIPSGATCTAEFTNTAPVWDTEKQGWYSPTGGEESYRYLEYKLIKATAAYTKKSVFIQRDFDMVFDHVAGKIDIEADLGITGDVTFTGSATFGNGSIMGFAEDGTPLLCKLLSIAAGTGNTVNHGIATAATGGKIKSFTVFQGGWVAAGSSQAGYWGINYFDTSAIIGGGIKGIGFNDTQFWIDRWSTSAHGGIKIMVLYIS